MKKGTKSTIFMIGGTGYIGGSILHLMIESGYLENFEVSVLVRKSSDGEQLTSLGIRPVLGSIDDLTLLESEAAKADIVISNANCEHDASVDAIIAGLTQRFKQTGEKPILIHTSRAGVLSANSQGLGLSLIEDSQTSIWDDADAEAHLNIPDNAPHRHVDLKVLSAAKKGKLKTYLVIPPTVFGKGLGPFAEKRMSIQILRLAYYSMRNRKVMTVGKGENQWTNVHVADLAELYLLILEGAIKDIAPEGLKGIYYPSSEFFRWSDVADRIAHVLKEKNFIVNAAVTSGLPAGWFWGSNVLMKCTNGEFLGWSPKHGGTKEMMQDIEWDVHLMEKMVS